MRNTKLGHDNSSAINITVHMLCMRVKLLYVVHSTWNVRDLAVTDESVGV